MMIHAAHPRSPRLLWAGVAWIITGILLAFGIAYLVGGIEIAASSGPYEVVIRYVPGGMRTHGGVMLALGLVMAYGLLPVIYRRPMLERWLRRTLWFGVMPYSLWLVVAFAGSWWLNKTPALGGIIWWLATATLATLLVELPPPALDGRGDGA